jgi:hypothetical protein
MTPAPRLRYAFTPSPNPIRASAPDATSFVEIQVMVSNPGDPLALQELSIQIGDKSASGVLTTDPLLPQPDPLPGGWSCDPAGDALILTPPAQIVAPLVFTLARMEVDETPGTVPITVKEVSEDGSTIATDDTSYSLVKLPSDWVVTDFWADPPSLDAAHTPVTLQWQVTELGRDSAYQVQAGDGTVIGPITVDDHGVGSALTGPLEGSERFDLARLVKKNVLEPKPVATLTVRFGAPWISPYSHKEVQGTVAFLHWATGNAARCSVEFRGRTVEDGAPVDTWVDGYPLFVGLDSDGHVPTVTALGASLSATPQSFDFPEVAVATPRRQNVAGGSGAVAFAADGRQLFVGCAAGVMMLDPATGAASGMLQAWMMPVPPTVLAVVPSTGDVAVVGPPVQGPYGPQNFTVVMSLAQPDWPGAASEKGPRAGIAAWGEWIVTSDTQGAVWVEHPGGAGGADHEPHSCGSVTVGSRSPALAVASNATLLAGGVDGTLTVADLSALEAVDYMDPFTTRPVVVGAAPVAIGTGKVAVAVAAHAPVGIAVSQDGRLAHVDVAARSVGTPQPVLPSGVTSVALTPDGRYAIAGLADGHLAAVDVVSATMGPGLLPVGFAPVTVAVSPLWPRGPIAAAGAKGELLLL